MTDVVYLHRLSLIAILLIATALRVVQLDNYPTPAGATPPGLEHDEVAHWLINRGILAGNHALYFTEAYGHEALYHYLQAGFGALVGDHALGLRLPSVYLGVLMVATAYALNRRLFGVRAGWWSAAFLAVLFWPVFYSRLALRAIALPLFAGLSAVVWWHGWTHWQRSTGEEDKSALPRREGARPLHSRWFLLSGALAGLALHTYMAARAVPIFYALFTAYLALFHRQLFRAQWRQIAHFWLALAVVSLPLAAYLLLNPGAEVRLAEVDAPLRALLAGDLGPVMANARAIAGSFAFDGDPLWRQGIAGRPIFDPVLGLLFYAGIAVCLWRWREPRHAFVLLWLATASLPSLVTVDAPSTIRMINALPLLIAPPLVALAIVERVARSRLDSSVKANLHRLIHFDPELSPLWTRLSTDLPSTLVGGTLAILLMYHTWATVDGLWRIWPANDEVQFVWQAALTEAATYLDASADAGPVAVGGWTPDTMDPPTMELTLRRDDLALRFYDPATSLLLPNPGSGMAQLVRPAILPLASELEALTGPWQVLPEGAAGGRQFALYRYEARPVLRPTTPADEPFGDELVFLGYDVGPTCANPAAPCTVVTYWRVLATPDGPRRLFLHLVGPDGVPRAQEDRLGAPAEYWRPGDTLVQLLTLPQTDGELRLGVYNPASGARLTTAIAEYVLLEVR